jgi:phosphoribosylanthranilate isomerase
VIALSEDLGLTMLQFNGEEGPAFCAEATRRNGARAIKAAQISGPGDIRDLERFHVDFHLLDARSKDPKKRALRGGTGETFDWSLVRARRSKVPLILSGGLDAQNVADGIERTHPYAVDTASGTEAAPGRKDPQRLRDFFQAVEGSVATAAPAAGEGESLALSDDPPGTGIAVDPSTPVPSGHGVTVEDPAAIAGGGT